MEETGTNPATAEGSVDAQDILKKYDKEADYRNYSGIMARIVAALAITFSCFQLYTALFGVLDAMIQRSIHLSFGMALVFLLYPTSKKWSRTTLHPVDLALAIIGALRTFDTMYVTTNGQYETYTMAFYMFRLAFISEGGSGRSGGRLGFASTVATLLFLMIFIVAAAAQRYFRKKEVEL